MRRCFSIVLIVGPGLAFAQPADSLQREEVRKIFSALLPRMDLDTSRRSCDFKADWDADPENASTAPSASRTRLTIQQAIDPRGRNPGLFCSDAEREAQARKTVGATGTSVQVTALGFTYPEFSEDFKSATVYFQVWRKEMALGTRQDWSGSFGVIKLEKQNGGWLSKIVMTGNAN